MTIETLTKKANRLYNLNKEVKALEKEVKALKATLIEELGVGGKLSTSLVNILISSSVKRIADSNKLKEDGLFKHYSKESVSTTCYVKEKK